MEKWKEYLKREDFLLKCRAREFIRILEKANKINEFDVDLYFKTVEKMVVYDERRIVVGLFDGNEVKVSIL